MSKRFLATGSAVLIILALGVFTISNAFALNYYDYGFGGALSSQKPLSIQAFYKTDCDTFSASYKQDITNMKAKALSVQMSQDELKYQLTLIKLSRDEMCARAGDAKTLETICKGLKKEYGKQIKMIKAKGLSSQLPQSAVRKQIKEAKNLKKLACAKAQAAKKAMSDDEEAPAPAQ